MTNISDSSENAPDTGRRTQWHRWEMESLRPSRPTVAPPPTAQAARDALRERAEAMARARQTAKESGYQAGFEQGREAGYAQGMEAGLAEGRAQGSAQGHQEGYEQGWLAAREQADRLCAEQTAQFKTILDASAAAFENLAEECGQAMTDLAIQIAEHVLRTHLRQHPETVRCIVDDALRAIPHAQGLLSVHLHPEDLALLSRAPIDHDEPVAYRLVPDPEITQGGCRIETAGGAIDATLETRWQRSIAVLGREDSRA